MSSNRNKLNQFRTLLEKHLSDRKDILGILNNTLTELESLWDRQESDICILKDRELEFLENQLKEAHRKEQFINETGQQLTASLDLETIISTFHRLVESRIPVERILLAFYRHQDDSLVYRVFEEEHGNSGIPDTVYLSSVHRIVADTVADGKIKLKNNIPADPDEFFIRHGGSLLLSPLKLEGCVRGVIVLNTVNPEGYRREHKDFLVSVLPFLTVAVSNARSHEKIEVLNQELEKDKKELFSAYARISRMANYDSLTDLLIYGFLMNLFPGI